MDFTFNIYSLVLIIFGSLTTIITIYIYKRGGNAVRWFSLMMLSNAIWSIAYGLELASSTLSQITFFINIEYVGIATLPLNWFLFCLNFCGKECWYKKPLNLVLILIAPVVTILMVWTNPIHNLHYKELLLNMDGPFPMLEIHPGIWYYIFTVYFYLLLACGCYLIFMKFRVSDPIYRKQNYSLIIAALIPWIANIAYLLGFRPFGLIDDTPFAFIVTSFLILIGIYRFKLFDIIPIAREKVLELMQDGFLVLDQHYRVIDYNRSINRYTSIPQKKLISAIIEDVFPDQQELLDKIKTHEAGKIELIINKNNQKRFLEVDILFLNDNKINNDFTIIKLQDITIRKKESIKVREQANELQKLNQLKDRIFSIIAHDLRGPLVNLSEVLKMINNNLITIDEFKNISPTLSNDIIYTTDLLENILHWSRSQLKGFGISKELFNLRNLIINEINYHLPSAELKKIKIIHDVFPNEMVYADMLMFQIVIRNLIHNAIKFCNENCEIHITASYQKNKKLMLVCIKDNGIGIPNHILNKLFKSENITTRGTLNEKGTGLGLMVCKDFMTRNSGDITVESIEGKGSSFCITIPTSP